MIDIYTEFRDSDDEANCDDEAGCVRYSQRPVVGHAALLVSILLCLPFGVNASGAQEALEVAMGVGAPVLFNVDVSVDGQPIVVSVREGESPVDVAHRVGVERGLAAEGVTSLVQMLTRKALDVLGENAVKRIFFELPVRVEVSPGEIKGVKLTVYEESDPERLGQLFAERYNMPPAAAVRLQLEIVRQMESRTRLRIEVRLPGGNKRLLVVRNSETSEQAARRFGLENGLTAQGVEALRAHIDRQLEAAASDGKGGSKQAAPDLPESARTAATDSRMSAAADERPVLFVLPIGLPVAGKRKDLSLAVRAGDDASVLARDFVAQHRLVEAGINDAAAEVEISKAIVAEATRRGLLS